MDEIEKLLVPAGFKFEPTDEELVMCYLLPKLNGMPLPCGIITEKSVYGQNSTPWEIFDDRKDPWIPSPKCKNKKTIYVFTQLKKKSKGKKQVERTAGCGTWDGQTAPRKIKNGQGKIIGSRKYFSFESRTFGHDYIRTYGHWGMHEFSVPDGGDYVLCAITRDDSKRRVKELHRETPLVGVVQSNIINDLGSDRRTDGEGLSTSGSIHHVLLEEDTASRLSEIRHPLGLDVATLEIHQPLELEVPTNYDPKSLTEGEIFDQCNGFGNSSLSQGSKMIEYEGCGNPGELQGSIMIECNGFENPGELQAGSTMIGYNGFENLDEFQGSTMIEYNGLENLGGEFQGSALMGYGQQFGDLSVNNLQNQGEVYSDDNIFGFSFVDDMPSSMGDDVLDLSFLDGISMDEVLEPLLSEQGLGKRKLLEEVETPCTKKLCGTHMWMVA